VRLLSDSDIKKAVKDGYCYFEVYLHGDEDGGNLTGVRSREELNKLVARAAGFRHPSHVWLMVPRFWSDSQAMPTTVDDMARIQELFVPVDNKYVSVDETLPMKVTLSGSASVPSLEGAGTLTVV
jgi:hypothetical protein